METLEPRFGDPNRVSLVPMPVIGVTRKTGAQPLQPGSGRFDDQEIRKDAHQGTMMYPTKTALVIRVDLLSWQIANVAAFLSGGLAGTYPEIVGEPYRDGDGRLYTPMIREPVFILWRNERRTRPHPWSRGQPRHSLRNLYRAPVGTVNLAGLSALAAADRGE